MISREASHVRWRRMGLEVSHVLDLFADVVVIRVDDAA